MSQDNSLVAVLRGRRSVAQPRLAGSVIDDHTVVREALESARWAPNHKLTEPWRFYLLDDRRIEHLAELNAELLERGGSNADKVAAKREQWAAVPGVVIITVRSAADVDAVMRREDYAAVACAAQNFMLHLWSAGVASKWSTSAVWRHEEFWPLLGHGAWNHETAARVVTPNADAANGGAANGRATNDGANNGVATNEGTAPQEEVVGIFFYGIAAGVPAARRRLALPEVLHDFRA